MKHVCDFHYFYSTIYSFFALLVVMLVEDLILL